MRSRGYDRDRDRGDRDRGDRYGDEGGRRGGGMSRGYDRDDRRGYNDRRNR